MNIFSIVFPQTIYKTTSKFSGEIKVIDHVFERRLVVGGLTQSGGIVKGMWGKALNQSFIVSHLSLISNVLILGLGAGTVVEVINKKWPDAKIIGVEIDPIIIEIGKKYFGLNQIENLEIILDDAINFIHNTKYIIHNTRYDLIIVDLYKGYAVENNINNIEFLQKIAQKSAKNSFVIFNILKPQTNNFEAKIFLDKLSRIFKDIFCKRIIVNDFFFCAKPRKGGVNHSPKEVSCPWHEKERRERSKLAILSVGRRIM